MNEEIMRILKMVEDDKINADEAAKLIEAIESATPKDSWIDLNEEGEPESKTPGRKPSWLYVMVDGAEGGKKKNVRVRIPIKMARWALKFIPKSAQAQIKEKHGADLDFEELSAMIDELPVGEDIINVIDDEKGESVRIFLR